MITFKHLGTVGRFGNQLFQIASTIGIAARNNIQYLFPEWFNFDHAGKNPMSNIEVAHIFDYTLPSAPASFFSSWPTTVVPLHYEKITIPKRSDRSLYGFMQSEKYFDHVEDEIRMIFKTKYDPSVVNKTICSIHVRRGDYVNSRIYHNLDYAYYKKAIDFMRASGFNKFAIFSDDMSFAVGMLSPIIDETPGASIVNIESIDDRLEDYLHDFVKMESSGGVIMSNSSYPWWAGWLGRGLVVCPKDWFLSEDHSSRDIAAGGWVVL